MEDVNKLDIIELRNLFEKNGYAFCIASNFAEVCWYEKAGIEYAEPGDDLGRSMMVIAQRDAFHKVFDAPNKNVATMYHYKAKHDKGKVTVVSRFAGRKWNKYLLDKFSDTFELSMPDGTKEMIRLITPVGCMMMRYRSWSVMQPEMQKQYQTMIGKSIERLQLIAKLDRTTAAFFLKTAKDFKN